MLQKIKGVATMCDGYRELTNVLVWELGNNEPTTKLNKLAERNGLYTVANDMKNAVSTVGYMEFTSSDKERVKNLYYEKHFDTIARKKKYSKMLEICEVESNKFKVSGTNFYFVSDDKISETIDINKYALMTFWCGCFLIDLTDTEKLPICIGDNLHIKILTRYLDNKANMIIYKL